MLSLNKYRGEYENFAHGFSCFSLRLAASENEKLFLAVNFLSHNKRCKIIYASFCKGTTTFRKKRHTSLPFNSFLEEDVDEEEKSNELFNNLCFMRSSSLDAASRACLNKNIYDAIFRLRLNRNHYSLRWKFMRWFRLTIKRESQTLMMAERTIRSREWNYFATFVTAWVISKKFHIKTITMTNCQDFLTLLTSGLIFYSLLMLTFKCLDYCFNCIQWFA